MRKVILPFLFLFLTVGCSSRPDPYFYVDHWYVRQNAVPRYFATYDVFYLHPDLYGGEQVSTTNYDYVVKQTVDLFGKRVRVFAPMCHNADDLEDAFDWYLDNYFGDEQPFVFIGEGDGGKLLEKLVEDAKKEGLVSSHIVTNFVGGFVTSNLVERINEEVRECLYLRQWKLD